MAADDPPRIRLRRLVKHYDQRTALRGIDLDVAGAQILGVVGPDGAGKTTLLRALAGLLEIEAEEASVLGHDLRGDVTPLKEVLGYVPQVFSLYRDFAGLAPMALFALLLTFFDMPAVYASVALGMAVCALLAHWLPRSM